MSASAPFTIVSRGRRNTRRPNRQENRRRAPVPQMEEYGSRGFKKSFPTLHADGLRCTAVTSSPAGAWGRGAPRVSNKQVTEVKKTVMVTPTKKPAFAGICAYCKESGHHIRNCAKAQRATARKMARQQAEQQRKRQMKAERKEEARRWFQERLRQQILRAEAEKVARQQFIQPEETDSDSSSDEEEDEDIVVGPGHLHASWEEKRAAKIVSTIESKKAEMTGVSWADAADLEDEIEALEDELEALRDNILSVENGDRSPSPEPSIFLA